MTDQRKILVTGAAGFIGSHIAKGFLDLGWTVVGLDDLSSGNTANLDAIAHDNFTFIDGDIRDLETCRRACDGVDVVSHQAAIGSVVKSIEEPELVHAVNVGGFQNILKAADEAGASRVVYASSCAIYGDAGEGAINEETAPNPLSPYAEGKLQNELDAKMAAIETVGFRYFNIYGPRQDPNGAYAAVLPKWKQAMREGKVIQIFGDGETMRDFCHVSDVVRANIIAATTDDSNAIGQVYNVGSGHTTTLNALFALLKSEIPDYDLEPEYHDFREGDIRVSRCDNTKARELLGFTPAVKLQDGIGDA